jgi:hypothetical protein
MRTHGAELSQAALTTVPDVIMAMVGSMTITFTMGILAKTFLAIINRMFNYRDPIDVFEILLVRYRRCC